LVSGSLDLSALRRFPALPASSASGPFLLLDPRFHTTSAPGKSDQPLTSNRPYVAARAYPVAFQLTCVTRRP